MSLREFDERLSSARVNRDITTTENRDREITMKHELSEYKIKRKVFSGNSKKYSVSQSSPNMEFGVVENAKSTMNPLYRCKTVMGGAYKRLSSADVNKSNLKDHFGKAVTVSDSGKPSRQSSGASWKTLTPPQNHRRLTQRRMTVGDLASLGEGSTASSSDSSGLTEEDRYERFLTVLRGEHTKLPEIFAYR